MIWNQQLEIREKLLLKEITCYKTYNRLTQKEIIGKIEKKFQNLQDKDTRNANEAKEAKEKRQKFLKKYFHFYLIIIHLFMKQYLQL